MMSGHHPVGQHNCHHAHHHGSGTKRAVVISLIVNIILTVLKWVAFAFTRSPSLFGEAAHSTADMLNPMILWIGYRRSRRPKDDDHPLGHGREVFFWSLMAAQMMFVIGAVATAYHGIQSIVTHHIPEISWWAGGIMLFALVAEGYSFLIAWRNIKSSDNKNTTASDAAKSKNPILLALILENSVDMLGVLLAVCGYGLYLATGNPIWDGIFSLVIATLLTCSSVFLIRRNMSLITGETADQKTKDKIIDTLNSIPTVLCVKEVIATMIGPEEIKCRIKLRLKKEQIATEFATEIHETCQCQEAIIWTMERISNERKKIIEIVIKEVDDVVSVELDCY